MRVVIQRTASSAVTINGTEHRPCAGGMLILLGIEQEDTTEDLEWLCRKIISLRIFPDEEGVMNRSILEDGGSVLLISQFTLFASTRKGNRPSYIRAARPETAIPLYEKFVARLEELLGKTVVTGTFGADMKVELVNDGPVTIIIDSRLKE